MDQGNTAWSARLRRSRTAVAAMGVAAVMAAAAVPSAAWAADPDVTISGSGSVGPQPAINQLMSGIHASSGQRVNYAGTGSSAGREDFLNGVVDFAITDMPFRSLGTDPSMPTQPFTYIPVVASPVSLVYRLRGVDGERITDLRLSADVTAKIFSGAITAWNDPAIQALNPLTFLPAEPITPVTRGDADGTTVALTQWMSQSAPVSWPAGPSAQIASTTPHFHSGLGPIAIAGYVAQVYGEGAIGYVDSTFASMAGLVSARIVNRAGYVVSPTAAATSIAMLGATGRPDGSLDLVGANRSTDPRAYPIVDVSYAIAYTQQNAFFTAAKAQALGDFLGYALCAGQGVIAGLGYGPLPLPILSGARDRIAMIAGATPFDLASCANPTFVPGDTASSNVLLRTAPFPPASDLADLAVARESVTNMQVTVADSGRFELDAPAVSVVDFGDVARGETSAPASLGSFRIIDDRDSLLGWNLRVDVADFAGAGGATLPSGSLGFAPVATGLPAGFAVAAPQVAGRATYPFTAATATPGISTGGDGIAVGADLTFHAPTSAPGGEYHSTVTVTLVSR